MDFNFTGSIASILGALISIIILIQSLLVKNEIKMLQARHLFKFRSPQHLRNIDTHLSNINVLLRDYKNNGKEIESALSRANAELKSIANKTLDTETSKQILKSIKMNDSILRRGLSCRFIGFWSKYPIRANYESVWKAYKHLQFTHTMLQNLIEDNKRSFK